MAKRATAVKATGVTKRSPAVKKAAKPKAHASPAPVVEQIILDEDERVYSYDEDFAVMSKPKRARVDTTAASDNIEEQEVTMVIPSKSRLAGYNAMKNRPGVSDEDVSAEYPDVARYLEEYKKVQQQLFSAIKDGGSGANVKSALAPAIQPSKAQTKTKQHAVTPLTSSPDLPNSKAVTLHGSEITPAAKVILDSLEAANPYPHAVPVGRKTSQFVLETPEGDRRQAFQYWPCCIRCAKEYFAIPDLQCVSADDSADAKCARCKRKNKACLEVRIVYFEVHMTAYLMLTDLS